MNYNRLSCQSTCPSLLKYSSNPCLTSCAIPLPLLTIEKIGGSDSTTVSPDAHWGILYQNCRLIPRPLKLIIFV